MPRAPPPSSPPPSPPPPFPPPSPPPAITMSTPPPPPTDLLGHQDSPAASSSTDPDPDHGITPLFSYRDAERQYYRRSQPEMRLYYDPPPYSKPRTARDLNLDYGHRLTALQMSTIAYILHMRAQCRAVQGEGRYPEIDDRLKALGVVLREERRQLQLAVALVEKYGFGFEGAEDEDEDEDEDEGEEGEEEEGGKIDGGMDTERSDVQSVEMSAKSDSEASSSEWGGIGEASNADSDFSMAADAGSDGEASTSEWSGIHDTSNAEPGSNGETSNVDSDVCMVEDAESGGEPSSAEGSGHGKASTADGSDNGKACSADGSGDGKACSADGSDNGKTFWVERDRESVAANAGSDDEMSTLARSGIDATSNADSDFSMAAEGDAESDGESSTSSRNGSMAANAGSVCEHRVSSARSDPDEDEYIYAHWVGIDRSVLYKHFPHWRDVDLYPRAVRTAAPDFHQQGVPVEQVVRMNFGNIARRQYGFDYFSRGGAGYVRLFRTMEVVDVMEEEYASELSQ
ncbi:hypothetical protein BZA05DRAFT_459296 [Tricharina praecox]|uniref:uncharacterized protein n=1 Tax=Tricharina praecox TaxID=43433 RepID=UPI0022209F8B|nr:uncharacterized protein BZA05DRAFT_459296 [Tricharina praecox]KAI5844815.1 hypothetical protein BZA05DRAFT_459296 [Tricharina praecox]